MWKKAFTLLELLVVIAVIALLMAIIMPVLNLAKDQGRLSEQHAASGDRSDAVPDGVGRSPEQRERAL